MTDGNENGKEITGKVTGAVFFAISLGLLFLSLKMRRINEAFFYQLNTFNFSGHYLTYDVAHVALQLKSHFWHIFKMYFFSYLLPVFLLVLPAIYLASIGFRKMLGEDGEKFDISLFFKNERMEKLLIGFIFLFCLCFVLALHFSILLDFPLVSDEYSYLFQADIMKTGRLHAQSPPMPESFKCANIINDGKWYSKYTIGWPLLLTLGALVNLPFIINALLAGGSLVLIHLLTKEIWNRGAALAGVFLALFSPYFILLAGTYFPHTATGFFILLMYLSLFRMKDTGGWKYPILAGLSIAFLFLIRPADGGVILLGAVPAFLYYWWKSGDRRSFFIKSIPFIAGVGAGLGILLMVNYMQNGNPMLFSFEKYRSIEKWGFGAIRHTPLKGLWNFAFSYMRMGFWVVPFLTLGSLISLFRKKVEAYMLAIPILGFVLFYFFYYSLGNIEFGARYYYPAFILMVPLAAGGLESLSRLWEKSPWAPGKSIVVGVMFAAVFLSLYGIYPALLPGIQKQYAMNKKLMAWMKDAPQIQDKTLIFIRDVPDKITRVFTRNRWDYQNEESLLALFLMPEENRELIGKFPDRKPYVVYFDYGKNKFEAEPYPEKGMKTPFNYICAAINYKKSIFDEKKTCEAFLKARDLDPGNPSILFNLGYFYFETGAYEKGVEILSGLVKKNPEMAEAWYYLGRCLGEMGEKEQAAKILLEYINRFPQSSRVEWAKDWINYYRGM